MASGQNYIFPIIRRLMPWKYLMCVVVMFGCAFFVSHQYQSARSRCVKECQEAHPRLLSPSSHENDCDKCAEVAERNFPSWYRLFGWPEGVGAWAILLTLLAIAEQTHQTRRAADAGAESADAAYGGVTAALAQLDLMKAKERARLDIKAATFEIENPEEMWSLQATIDLRNIGSSRAYVGKSAGTMYVTTSSEDPSAALEDSFLTLNLPDKFLDPSVSSVSVPFWFWSSIPDEQDPLPPNLETFAAEVNAGNRFIHLCGFVEYETLGTMWRREFWYLRKESIGAMLFMTVNPQTEQGKMHSHYWSEQKNIEYEIKANQDTTGQTEF